MLFLSSSAFSAPLRETSFLLIPRKSPIIRTAHQLFSLIRRRQFYFKQPSRPMGILVQLFRRSSQQIVYRSAWPETGGKISPTAFTDSPDPIVFPFSAVAPTFGRST